MLEFLDLDVFTFTTQYIKKTFRIFTKVILMNMLQLIAKFKQHCIHIIFSFISNMI